MAYEIPVYLFVGFLEAGKTKFIQETMEDIQFDSGDKTLLLVCEEGEEEYDESKFAFGGTTVAVLEDKSQLNREHLEELAKKSGAGRVLIEYNGMWLMNDLYEALPDNWVVYQCLATADGTTIKTYARDNAMRSLLLDKLSSSELLVVNRAEDVNDEESRVLIHKLVRQASRRCDIAYEFRDGSVAYDDIPDPLPFDINAKVIEVADEDYGIWFMDCQSDPKKYAGKTVSFTVQVRHTPKAGKDSFVAGRRAMTCCEDDIEFVGLPCRYDDYKKLVEDDWIKLTAKVNVKYHPAFRGEGPVLTALKVLPTGEPKETVVTFS
ncbi:MAG: outer membrane insertion C- signal [Oscillospiraceae bacterium]|nr:outer membrane insertion C- signal [Oscillospiraceae bacterium]